MWPIKIIALLKVVLTVTNDIATDNRLHKIASTLLMNGYEVTVVGRLLKHSPQVNDRDYKVRRLKLWFKRGPLFYINYNLVLFFYLVKNRYKVVVSNDLDTLLACYLSTKINKAVLVFDSHEYFTGVPELVDRNFVRGIWKALEKWLIPKLKYAYTVSGMIANKYFEEYKIDFKIIRNAGTFRFDNEFEMEKDETEKQTIIYQGVLNKGRGLETMIEAMKYIDNCNLQIIGDGDIEEELHRLVNYFGLASRVHFLGRLPHKELWQYTHKADLGISLEEDLGENYRFALPNKLFDYIQARIPVLVSDLPEMKNVVDTYQIGEIAIYREPELIAEQIKRMLSDTEKRSVWKTNLELAARELCWQREEEKLIQLFRRARLDAVGY